MRTCTQCGCSDAQACVFEDGTTCEWVAGDLCSACDSSTTARPTGYPIYGPAGEVLTFV